jgi:hypothetical protein
MGFFKALAYIAGGVGAVILAPVTGGGSIAAAIGVMGTTTTAGALIGASVGATAAAIDHSVSGKKEAYSQGHSHGTNEGYKAGYATATTKYEQKVQELTTRLAGYHDLDKKLLAMYAVGLAAANADGDICQEEREELDYFVGGILSGHYPLHIKNTVTKLTKNPPTLEQALVFARDSKLPTKDIEDIIDLIINADGVVESEEVEFRKQWWAIASSYEFEFDKSN